MVAQIIGQKEALVDAGAYRVMVKLTPQAASALGVNPGQPLVVRFDNAPDAEGFYRVARSRSVEMSIPWGDKTAVLQPTAWSTVVFQTPQQTIAGPTSINVFSR